MGPCFRRDDGEIVVALRRGRHVSDSFAGQTLETARRALTARFRTNSIGSAELDARMLVGAVLGLDLTGIIAAAVRPLTSDDAVRLERADPALYPLRRNRGSRNRGPRSRPAPRAGRWRRRT